MWGGVFYRNKMIYSCLDDCSGTVCASGPGANEGCLVGGNSVFCCLVDGVSFCVFDVTIFLWACPPVGGVLDVVW